MSFSADKTLRLWNLTELPAPAIETEPPAPTLVVTGKARRFTNKDVAAAAFSPDGRLLASADTHPANLRVWDVATGQMRTRLKKPVRGGTTSVAFSPDGRRLYANWGEEGVRTWDVASWLVLGKSLPGRSLSPDGAFRSTIQIAQRRGTAISLTLWARGDRKEYCRFPVDSNANVSLSFTPDHSRLAFLGNRGNLYLFDLKDKKQLAQFSVNRGNNAYHVCLTPDGRQALVSHSTGELRLWDLEEQKEFRVFTGHTSMVYTMVFSADARWLFSGDHSGVVRAWDVKEAKSLAVLEGPSRAAVKLVLSPDGRWLAAAAQDGLFVWRIASRAPSVPPKVPAK